jgi:hypothetical protein
VTNRRTRSHRHRKSWPARHKALTGITALGAIIVIGTVANAAGRTPKSTANMTAATTAATTSATQAASPASAASGCTAQARNWVSSAGRTEVSTFATDLSAFATASQTLTDDAYGTTSSDISGGAAPAADAAAMRSAAAAIQSDALVVEVDPGPACVPGLSGTLTTAAGDYSKAATDAINGLNHLSAGNKAAALADLRSASTAIGDGNAKLDAAASAIQAVNASQGG